MDPLQALVLGIVQGLTEFLPISSSAHLILVPWLLGWQDPGLTFDIALHAGTLIAVVAYFWRDWLGLLGGFVSSIRRRAITGDPQSELFWLLVVASIPGAIVGAVAEKAVESWLRAPAIVATLMISLAVVLLVAEAVAKRTRQLKDVNLHDALVIGVSQALAVCPGISRSGITITAGLFRGLTRQTAARFSFLMSTPIIAGAVLLSTVKVAKSGVPADERLPFVVGFLAAAIVGFLAIKFLIGYLQSHSLRVFAYYRFVVGFGVLAIILLGIRG